MMPPTVPIQAISFDFADTLYPHRPDEMARILRAIADALPPAPLSPAAFDHFHETFLAVRDRQFQENRATLQENDLDARFSACARAVGTEPSPAILARMREAYSQGFVDAMVLPEWLPDLVARLAGRYRLCVVSNYPLSEPIRRTLERDGLMPHLSTVVVSADLGVIKPHPALFAAACEGLGGVSPGAVLHIGDDWDADILGATRAGMQTIYTRQWRAVPDRHYGAEGAAPLAEITDLRELPGLLS